MSAGMYVVAPAVPSEDVHRVRYCRDDAVELAANHNARFPKLPMFVWKVATDGTLQRDGQSK